MCYKTYCNKVFVSTLIANIVQSKITLEVSIYVRRFKTDSV